MKTLKFRPYLIPPILSGEKTSTWRIFDDKDLQKGDEVIFLNWETKDPFAKVIIKEVLEKPLGNLSNKDKEGHEHFDSMEEMLARLSEYYKTKVTPETSVKVLKFKLI